MLSADKLKTWYVKLEKVINWNGKVILSDDVIVVKSTKLETWAEEFTDILEKLNYV